MTRPDFSTLVGYFRSAMLDVRKSLNRHKQHLLIVGGFLGLIILLALGSALVGLAVARNRHASTIDPDMAQGYSLEAARVLRDLYMPGPSVGETPFPLAFEPDPKYTGEGALRLHNDMSRVDIRGLEARRKAELEAIYEALD